MSRKNYHDKRHEYKGYYGAAGEIDELITAILSAAYTETLEQLNTIFVDGALKKLRPYLVGRKQTNLDMDVYEHPANIPRLIYLQMGTIALGFTANHFYPVVPTDYKLIINEFGLDWTIPLGVVVNNGDPLLSSFYTIIYGNGLLGVGRSIYGLLRKIMPSNANEPVVAPNESSRTQDDLKADSSFLNLISSVIGLNRNVKPNLKGEVPLGAAEFTVVSDQMKVKRMRKKKKQHTSASDVLAEKILISALDNLHG